MRAQHLLTQRFTAEFSIRPFLEHHPQATLERLAQWTQDPSEHVRRLVSEGTRPRLPWGRRLKAFQADPTPVLNLLERLKDDPSLYVRRSVANNLNDIGKDHPDRLVALACRWWSESTRLGSEPLRAQRQWLVAHGLRSLLKAGHPGALGVLGHGELPEVRLLDPSLSPSPARMGARIRLGFSLHNPTDRVQSLLVDLRVHYRKAAGHTGPKVFKLRAVNLAPQATAVFAKTLSLAQMTTRQHHPGEHRVEALVNGQALALGSFELLP
jgi:3-methyladenine DNA glycosylase AlkC